MNRIDWWWPGKRRCSWSTVVDGEVQSVVSLVKEGEFCKRGEYEKTSRIWSYLLALCLLVYTNNVPGP